MRFASAAGDGQFKRWWDGRRERFHPDFVRFVDANLGKPVESLDGKPVSVTPRMGEEV